MKIFVTDRTNFAPDEVVKLGVDQIAHISTSDPWPRWLTELGITKPGLHVLDDPKPAAPEMAIDPKEQARAEIIAAFQDAGVIDEQQAQAVRDSLNVSPEAAEAVALANAEG